MTVISFVTYLRDASGRYPDKVMPRYRRLDALARDGAKWAQKQPNGRWVVVDEAAADQALGLATAPATQPQPMMVDA